MINLAQTRDRLAEVITPRFTGRVTVYRGALDATAAFPMIAVGAPSWRPDVQPCADLITLPVAVVVELPGGNAGAIQDQLESVWTDLVGGLREDLRAQPGLGVARTIVITRAEFGPFNVQGRDYPALVTYLDFYG